MDKKLLIAFDFDHTIVDGNTDTIVRQLLKTKPLQEYKPTECWTTYMKNIFKLLHEEGIDQSSYLSSITGIPPTPDMLNLFQYLNDPDIEIIIISDSNSVFIDMWLTAMNLKDMIKAIYTNQAFFESSGLLNISMYQNQNRCNVCPENLCKGSVLNEHLKKSNKERVKFTTVAYVGDGRNDYCPCTKLLEEDYVFARKGYYLEKHLTGGSLKEVERKMQVDAVICTWTSASEIKLKLSEVFLKLENAKY